MPLSLISGAASADHAGAVLDRFAVAAARDGVLVVPTHDDVDRFERELCGRPGGALGGSVLSFPRLVEEASRAAGTDRAAPLSRLQRIWLARLASRRAKLRLLRASARRHGFAPALERLLTELQAEGVDAASLAAAAEGVGSRGPERELAELFAGYERLRDELGRTDQHLLAARATAALRADPDRWRARPVLLYGFDDLSREQLELIAALASGCEVTVALPHESRPALAVRDRLLAVLRDELGARVAEQSAAESPGPETRSGTLHELERRLFEPDSEPIAPDGSLSLLEAGSERAEAELIGRRIAHLIDGGADPDEIAIAARDPDAHGAAIAAVLGELGIPAAVEGSLPLAATATGTTLLGLLALATGEGTAERLVAFLRGPARGAPEDIDWLERRIRRQRISDLGEALGAWGGLGGRRVWELDALAEAGDDPAALAETAGRIAREIAERPHLRAAPRPGAGAALELRAAAEASAALAEAAALGPHAPGRNELAELLGHVRVPLWRGPTSGRVRILSPYRLRARPVAHLFVAGLVDGSFPAHRAPEPLLSDERRRELGLPARRDPAAEERYQFYTCVSRATRSLTLAYAPLPGEGSEARSPFVDEVRDLLDPPPTPELADDPLEAEITIRRGPEDVIPEPAEACTPRELARALAPIEPAEANRLLVVIEVPAEVRERVGAALEEARAALAAATAPGPLAEPAVLESLAERDPFGASTLEEYDLCSYRWFVGHELAPVSIEPDPEPLEAGGIVHEALERLYREPPTGGRRPSAEDVERWIERAGELVGEIAGERGWRRDDASARIPLARIEAAVARFLRRDARIGGPLEPDPELLELGFGGREGDAHPAVDLGGLRLHGRIDRIDVSADRKALIRDYKLSTAVTPAAKLLAEGKLQLPLYMLAARELGLDPVGGLYHPLGASGDDRPRGVLDREQRGALIPGETEAHYGTDFVPPDELEELLEAARERAAEIAAGIREGRITRNPRGGECPRWCAYAPICRIERGGAPEPDPDEEEG